MAIALALVAAVLFGASDYLGGRAARVAPVLVITAVGEITGFVILSVVLPIGGTPMAPLDDLLWGVLAGISGVAGVMCLYVALAVGSMTAVAPISGVVGAAIPVCVGLALGERPGPLALVGVVVAACAVVLVSGVIEAADRRISTRQLLLALAAGTGFGVLFVAYDQTDESSGSWPLWSSRLFAGGVLIVVLLSRRRHSDRRPVAGVGYLAGVVIGSVALIATGTYLAATREGLLTIVAAVASLYPASTVVLATVIDRERMQRTQLFGLGLAALALVLVTVGR